MVMSFPLTAAGQFRSLTDSSTASKSHEGFLGTSRYDTRPRTTTSVQRGHKCTIVHMQDERPRSNC